MNFFDPYPHEYPTDRELKLRRGMEPDAPWSAADAPRAEEMLAWVRKHAHPWLLSRRIDRIQPCPGGVRTDGLVVRGERLHAEVVAAQAPSAVLVAVSAGPEVEEHAARLRREQRAPEAVLVEAAAAATLDLLLASAGARLCAEAERLDFLVLSPACPGDGDGFASDRPAMLRWLKRRQWPRTAYLDAADTGRLAPLFSRLALFPLAPPSPANRARAEIAPCPSCPEDACALRRAPYRPAPFPPPGASAPPARDAAPGPAEVPPEAIARLARERLVLEPGGADGSLLARFRFDGHTCGTRGAALSFDYTLVLGPAAAGHPLLRAECHPGAGSRGHERMCGWQKNPGFARCLAEDAPPLLGRTLGEALDWRPHGLPSACLCSEGSRLNTWRLVLRAVHHRLHSPAS